MRRVLHERYGDLGLGEADPRLQPIIGSMHVAGGFAIPALLGALIRFRADAAPQPEQVQLTADQIDALQLPDWKNQWPMKQLIADIDALEARHGRVVGDLNTDGLLNAAYHLYGQDLFAAFYGAPPPGAAPSRIDRRTDCRRRQLHPQPHRELLHRGEPHGGAPVPGTVLACELFCADDLAQELP
jgi:hypothetical protein